MTSLTPAPSARVGDVSPLSLEVLKTRPDFLRAARARNERMPGFMLQARRREHGNTVRVGFTCSKKVGNAVTRNHAKRRLREIARTEIPAHGRAGWDYVLVGRRHVTSKRDFIELRADLIRALDKIHA